MRILLTADPMLPVPPDGYGGIERIVDALVGEYRSRGHVVGLMAKSGSRCPADALFAWPGANVRGFADTVRNAAALWNAVQRFRPDVLHSFSRQAYLLPLLLARLPKVMSYQRHTGGRQIALAARLGGRSLRFTGCSEFICAQGRAAGGAWQVVPNFVDVSRYTFVPEVPADAPLVFLSRIDADKGPHLAIAIARASGRRLILAGNRSENGPQRVYWETQVAPHLGAGVEWVGEVDDVKKNALLGRAAALLVPIQWDEPFGIVFVEAFACGTPVLTCRRGATPEIVEPGRTGLFVSDVADGAAAVARLGGLDRAACRRAVETCFSLPVCGTQYLEFYRSGAR